MPSDEADVLSANAAFYDAFRGDDLTAMDSLWSRRAPVACIHPGWPALVGRARVLASWREIFTSGAPPIRCTRAHAHVLGDVAFVTCSEVLDNVQLVATNLFVREDGQWRIVHHHAGPVSVRTEEPVRAPPKGDVN